MALIINGEEVEAAGKTLADYLEEAGYDTRGLADERGGAVGPSCNVPRAHFRWATG